jgi:hypothetical protein
MIPPTVIMFEPNRKIPAPKGAGTTPTNYFTDLTGHDGR